ncbi:MAG: cytochrome c oxidase accessory protein CcoG [Alphaproteobacteria bacterium CG_4_10_14_0_8_um_filter_53_9]|nr:MAG: cytochrome c oxidase accessory protein CcoG [Alphaproteobacteria bacterium CG_4_10_14_0_8_um_filter_53_9]
MSKISIEHVDTTPVDTDEITLWKLFEARKPIYPAKVKGTFRSTKWAFMVVLLGLYYILPWVRWHRGEGAPDQAILVDTISRKFYFFFIELWPQEVFYFTGLLLLAALGLFFATSLFGRVWCGYACPQTVWTDLFLHVERFFEGDRNAQIKLNKLPWHSPKKLAKKLPKHATWLLIGLATGGAWVFYFQDAPTLWANMLAGDFHFVPTFWMIFLTFSTYVMAGFAREQVCTYMCPYARFQGAMFDEDSLLVTYDKERGEPRGKHDKAGDCIDCGRCVAVCPTGIDIRDGQQYRCINCALCIDACNTVMAKIGKPKGLIRYNNLTGTIPANVGGWGVITHARLLRPRTLYYALIMLVVSGAMLGALLTKSTLEMSVLHNRNPLYVILTTGQVRNTYTLRLINKTWQHQSFTVSASNPALTLRTAQATAKTGAALTLTVAPGKVAEYTVFAEQPLVQEDGTRLPTHQNLIFTAINNGGEETTYTTVFIAPSL